MKINSSIIKLCFYSLIIFLFACTKAGLGGNGAIIGKCRHHSTTVPFDTIGIKYGATELPGVTPQDFDNVIYADDSGQFRFSGLKKGNYYLYGWGYDPTRAVGVTGGQGVKLTSSSDIVNLPYLQITEGD